VAARRPPWAGYARRQPEKTVLHKVVRESLETFLANMPVAFSCRTPDSDGVGPPPPDFAASAKRAADQALARAGPAAQVDRLEGEGLRCCLEIGA
jgi:hypothetical protein